MSGRVERTMPHTSNFVDEITAAVVVGIADAIHAAESKPTYPKDHKAGMRVPKGGSSCANCEYLADNKKDCTNTFFQKWNGSPVIPAPIDEYCSDWFEPNDEIQAYGTSEGVKKAWDTRGRGRLTLGEEIPPKDKPVVMVFGGSFNPPHVAHYEALERARSLLQQEGYNVEKVIVAPTASKLLKAKLGEGAYPLDNRVEMSKLTFTGPGIEVTGEPAKQAEEQTGKLRRTQLADWAQKENPDATVVNVTGEDAAPGHPPGFPSLYAGDKGSNHEGYYYIALDRPPGGLSSTKIREAVAEGATPPGMTPDALAHLKTMLGLGNWTKSGVNVGIFDRPESHTEGETVPVEKVFHNPPPSDDERKDIANAFHKASKVGELDLPVDKIIPMQKTLENARLARIAQGIPLVKSVSPVAVFHKDDNYYLMDGHHRAGGDIMRGDKKLRVSEYAVQASIQAASEDKDWWFAAYMMGAEDMDAYRVWGAEEEEWHGVDLDGTIAHYTNFKGVSKIGKPIEGEALAQVKEWLKKGENVKIFTARASDPAAVKHIKKWCKKYLGQELEVTNIKDTGMLDLLDDRAHRVEKNTGKIQATEQSFGGQQKGSLWNEIKLVGFSGPEEEALRAALSRIPPELLTNVSCIQSASELNAKHGRYLPDEKKILINPGNLTLRQRFGSGETPISHADLAVVHEVGHSLYNALSPEEKQRWNEISGWMKGTKKGQAPPYEEKRPGWERIISKWTHRIGAKFPRYYGEKNPDEDFADCFSFFIQNKAYRIGDDKKKFFEDYIQAHVHRYPQASIQSPLHAYGTHEGLEKAWDTRGRGRRARPALGHWPSKIPPEITKAARRVHDIVSRNPRMYSRRAMTNTLRRLGSENVERAIEQLRSRGFVRSVRTPTSGDRGRYVLETVRPLSPDPSTLPPVTPTGKATETLQRVRQESAPTPTPSAPTTPVAQPKQQWFTPRTSYSIAHAFLSDEQWHTEGELERAIERNWGLLSRAGIRQRIDRIAERASEHGYQLEQNAGRMRLVPSRTPSTPSQVPTTPSTPASVPSRIANPAFGQRQPVGFLTQDPSTFSSDMSRVNITASDKIKFEEKFKMSPQQYRETLLKGVDDNLIDSTNMYISSRRDGNLWQIRANGPGFEISRSIDLAAKSVHHGYFSMNESMQGHGLAKTIFGNSIDIYDHLGLEKIGVSASLSGGGYAWARFGFVPDAMSWRSVADNATRRAERDPTLTPDIKAQIKLISKIQDPKAIWLLAGLKDSKGESVGAKFLRGEDWRGTLNLTDPEQYAVVRDYAGRAKR